MRLMYGITVFLLISTLSLYLISNLFVQVLIRGQRLKQDGAYFKIREMYHINFVFVLFNNEKKKQTNKQKEKKQMKTSNCQQ